MSTSIRKLRKKMPKEELEKYHERVKKSAHVFRSKKDFNRQENKKKTREEPENES